MITYIDAKNRDKYFQLFQDAKNILLDAEANGISLEDILPPNVEGAEHFEIATLNQYFGYLDQLVKLAADENIKSYLLRLPLDEDYFEIDTNTRVIKVPTSFSRNGVGVQGDETAEIVYFMVDRYFDHIDLANKDMNIVIEWETKDKDRRIIKGISPSFGRDTATNPKKIIFGWPIYHDLTDSATPIKFAVRFYTLGKKDEDTNTSPILYSLSTLPAEVSIGATLNYDIVNSEQIGPTAEQIRNRIQQAGIYDDTFPVPGIPNASSLKAYSNDVEIDSKIVDLADDGEISLKISALPSDFGAIQYIWHKQNYDPISGTYDTLDHTITSALSGANETYEEVKTNLTETIYYTPIKSNNNDSPIRYSIIDVTEILENGQNTEYNSEYQGYKKKDQNYYYQLFRKCSTITVDSTGIYTVDVRARSGPNSVDLQMDSAEGIKIPGPSKPVIISSEADDNMVHVIVDDNGKAILTAEVDYNEADKNSQQASLTCDWKEIINGIGQSLVDSETLPKEMEFYILTQDNHGTLPSDPAFADNLSDASYNQSANNVYLEQKGSNIYVYIKHDLKEYVSTDEGQGPDAHAWLAFDIDTKTNDIEQVTYGKGENKGFLTYTDVLKAESVGLDNGHVVFWAKVDTLLGSSRILTFNDIDFTIYFIEGLPTVAAYDGSKTDTLTISGLTQIPLDKKYYLDVTATRNKINTTKSSVEYRITEAPKTPVIKRYLLKNGSVQLDLSDYDKEKIPVLTHRYNKSGDYSTINIYVDEQNLHFDELSYVWMKADVQTGDDSDWVSGTEVPEIKIDFENDTPVLITNSQTHELEQVTTPSLTINDEIEPGYYYCLVTNTLNGNTAWNASTYYNLVD